jgi:hypothetical protein
MTAEVARCTELLLELLSDGRLAGLPTHAEAAAAGAASQPTGHWRADGSAGGTLELAAHRWSPQVGNLSTFKAESHCRVETQLGGLAMRCGKSCSL